MAQLLEVTIHFKKPNEKKIVKIKIKNQMILCTCNLHLTRHILYFPAGADHHQHNTPGTSLQVPGGLYN